MYLYCNIFRNNILYIIRLVMNLKLIRKEYSTYTSGVLFIDDKKFCETLEDVNRDINRNGKFDNGEAKIYGDTCIPYGKYKVTVTYSPKFKRELPEILGVNSFSGIRIHRGNTTADNKFKLVQIKDDTLGCILCGEKVVNGYLYNSTPYELELTSMLKQEVTRGNTIYLDIVKYEENS